MKKIIKMQEFPIFIVLVVLSVIIGIINPAFFTFENFLDLLKSNIVLAMMSMGMLLVLLTGGIDVSCSSIVAAVTIFVGNSLIHITSNIFLTVFMACGLGVVLGLVNGFLIARIKIPPIVATLGTMNVILGINLYITNGDWITGVPQSFIAFGDRIMLPVKTGDGRLIGFPVQVLFLVVVIAATWFILKRTLIGRGIYAVGGNRESAERMGFNSVRILIFVYGIEGLFIGLAAVVHTSIMRQVDPNAFLGFEMQVIAAVVLGGASTLGGYGSVLGTMLGVALFCVINNGMILMHIPTFWQKIVIGLIIVASVCIDMYQKNKAEKTKVRVDVE
jgi:ribose/xylose/arabinose/galactoside ABC-type transport system permease subunit